MAVDIKEDTSEVSKLGTWGSYDGMKRGHSRIERTADSNDEREIIKNGDCKFMRVCKGTWLGSEMDK